jgi:ribosomal protein L19E
METIAQTTNIVDDIKDLAKQGLSYTNIAQQLNVSYNIVYQTAKKYNISIIDTRGGKRNGSGFRCDIKDTWSIFIRETLFNDDGSPKNKKDRGSIQKTLYQNMCEKFKDDDFENKIKPTTLGIICRKMLT